MGFWPDVNRGDKVQHHMLLENNLRHMVNAQNGFSSRPNGRTLGSVVRVRIWNASSANFASGAPVMFDNTKALCDDAFPAIPCTDSSRFWGVCENDLAIGEVGECVISGAVGVTFSSGTVGNYAIPDASGTAFVRGNVGVPIMFQNTVMGGVVCLGASAASDAPLASHAPFFLTIGGGTATVNVAAGLASRNGEVVSVSAGTVTVPQAGYVYLYTAFSDDTGWESGFHYGVAASLVSLVGGTVECFPLGYVETANGVVTAVESFSVPMAVFIKAGTCTNDGAENAQQ